MSLVGGFLWLSNMTMFSIAYASGQLARFLTNPGPSHFRAALRLLAYLRDNGDQPLVFAHLPGKVMIADLLTKAVARALFASLMDLIRQYAESGVACPST